MKKIFTMLLAVAMSASVLVGCADKKETADDGIVNVSIGSWPTEDSQYYEPKMKRVEAFEAKNPNIKITPDSYAYDTRTFVAKNAAGTIPTALGVPITELDKFVENGYCRDIKDAMVKSGLYDAMNPEYIEPVTGENGEVWALVKRKYVQGLYINKALFRQAGLVNEDGTIKVPQTYDELAEFSAIIKEKTGQAGLALPTMNNFGGWHFINVAWSYGTEFMKEENGKWIATFDSPEFKNACRWLYDMKWKYDGLVENTFIDMGAYRKYFGTGQAAMMIDSPVVGALTQQYGMNKDDLMCVSLPAGPEGRYSQMGADLIFIRKDATDEQVDAVLKWYIEQDGFTMTISDETLLKTEEDLKINVSENAMIMPSSLNKIFSMFSNREREADLDAVRDKYANLKVEDYEDYYYGSSKYGVVQRAEEPMNCQQLYAEMDNIIQKIISDKNVDIDKTVAEAQTRFQQNILDKN